MKNETKWSIDQAHSEISFSIRHLMIAHVKGIFRNFNASIYTNAKDFATTEIDIYIDASSIYTGDRSRDEHLKGADFFDVKHYKQISFTSKTIGKPDASGNCELWGELTIKGITKKIQLQVKLGGMLKDPSGKEKAGFEVTGKINRTEWGLVWNTTLENGGLMISEDIHISCDIQLNYIGINDLSIKMHANE
ncbi:MAG: polyisoprenoid-binding protein [Chitinophagaceae bacterium]|nr:polyisoprenoid-binding protein [Chitinophagaceae bacterium]